MEPFDSKCFPSSQECKAGVFKFLRFEERSKKFSVFLTDQCGGRQTVETKLRSISFGQLWMGPKELKILKLVRSRLTQCISLVIIGFDQCEKKETFCHDSRIPFKVNRRRCPNLQTWDGKKCTGMYLQNYRVTQMSRDNSRLRHICALRLDVLKADAI